MSKIAEYKKQHPEYRNIPDLELADRLYQVAYKGKMSLMKILILKQINQNLNLRHQK